MFTTKKSPFVQLRGTLALALLAFAGAAGAQEMRATVNGDQIVFPDVQPVMMNNRVMVPVRGVFEHMDAIVVWDRNAQTVTAQRGSDQIKLPINSRYATVNGNRVELDAPAVVRNGRTMVPLRFLGESLGASVMWVQNTRTVEINTSLAYVNPAETKVLRMPAGTVMPFRLNQGLSSDGSKVGDHFRASLDTGDSTHYQGISSGSMLEGHVDVARAKNGQTPGVLGLAFDKVVTPSGQSYPIYGTLIGLDEDSVMNQNGRLVAKPKAKNDSLKWVGYGAGGGALIAVLTKNNILTSTLIGGALGWLAGEISKNPSKSNNVNQESGTKFGVRLTRDLLIRVPSNSDIGQK